jgi:hypothetical protein
MTGCKQGRSSKKKETGRRMKSVWFVGWLRLEIIFCFVARWQNSFGRVAGMLWDGVGHLIASRICGRI